ncbi:MAG: hypothetical protein ACOWW1_00625 [archaeon]
MPHVVLTGNISLMDIFEKIETFVVREDKTILKTSDKFINQDETSILVEALTIDDKNKTSFLVLISKREDGIVVRLYPQIEVEKTDSVKKILAKIADNLIAAFPSLNVGKTNLHEFLQNTP